MRSIAPVALCPLLLAFACGPSGRPTSTQPPASAPSWTLPSPASATGLCARSPVLRATWEGRRRTGSVRFGCLGKDPRGVHFVSQVFGEDSPKPAREIHLFVGRNGRLRRAEVRRAGTPGTDDAPFTETYYAHGGSLWAERHGDRREVARIDDGPPPWVAGPLDVGIAALMFRLGVGVGASGVEHRYVDPASHGISRVRYRLERRPDGIAAYADGVRYLFSSSDGTWARATLLEAEVGPFRLVFEPAPPEAGPLEPFGSLLPPVPKPVYRPPADLAIEPVEIPPGPEGPRLAGEKVRPRTLTGRTCGAVFFSGSGAQDRYGFVPHTSIDTGSWEITDAVARAGCIVLRFDDPGTGASDPAPKGAGFNAEIDDARRALAVLVSDPRVDTAKVVLMGHSSGTVVAMEIATEPVAGRHRAAAVVLLAAPARRLRYVVEDQVRHRFADAPKRREETLAEARRLWDALERGETPANFGSAAAWLRELNEREPLALLAKLRMPVLLLQGEKDIQVHPEKDFRPLAARIEGPKPPPGRAVRFSDLDHIFKEERGISKVAHYGDLSRRVDRRVPGEIVRFLGDAGVLPGGRRPESVHRAR